MALRGALITHRLRRPTRHPWRADWLLYRGLSTALRQAVERARSALPASNQASPRVLDLGCGERPWHTLFPGALCVGVDRGFEGANADVLADAAALPFADHSFDLVFSSQVLEHVAEVQPVLAESARVLRTGGSLVASVPFYWPLHEEPHDYRRFTSHGLRRALAEAGFEHCEVRADCGSLTMVVVAALDLLPRQRGRWLLFAPLVLVVNLLTVGAQRWSTDRRSTLNWVFTARRRQLGAGLRELG
jgi:SAM-dependent methyltransferase